MFAGTTGVRHTCLLRCLAVLAVALALAAPTVAPAAQYAFLVGVGKYATRELKELQYAESDVRALYYTLRSLGYQPNRIVVLSASAGAKDPRYVPFRKNILDEFELLIRTLSEQDSLLVALAGHGVQFEDDKDAYFCPADTDLGNRETLISLEKLYADLDLRCKATNRVLLVDACRNDPQTTLSRTSRPTVKLESVTRPQTLALPRSVAAFYSCSPGQEAFEHPDYQQGLFFYHVVAGLKGSADANKDGIVTLGELSEYVVPAVQDSARVKLRKLQTPELLNARGVVRLVERMTPVIINSIGMELIRISAGKYQRGARDGEGEDAERPRHWVQISRDFQVGKYPVTQGEYTRVMGHNPSLFSSNGGGSDEVRGMETTDFPVETVSWYDVIEFCNKLSVVEKLPPYYELTDVERDGQTITSATVRILGGNGYRLLTEAEWEYVARAGTDTVFPWGDSLSSSQANFDGNFPAGGAATGPHLKRTTKVGSYPANAWGLHDTAGNVWEWVWDVLNENEYQQFGSKTAVDPSGPDTGEFRVLRGGGWYLGGGWVCRSAFRNRREPEHRNSLCGFRVAQGQSSE
jgi:formylglycine-generating enzyme required for sulfatase activity